MSVSTASSPSFPPNWFFPSPSASSSAGNSSSMSLDAQAIQSHFTSILSEGYKKMDEFGFPDLNILIGPHKCAKSRLLLQLAYHIAAAAASAPSTDPRGDPFQPVVLILPKRRNLDDASHHTTANAATANSNSSSINSKALVGLFGSQQKANVLNKIQIKWYSDDSDLLRIVCHLHQLSGSSTSNPIGMNPRFIGIVYDSALQTEAAKVALVIARLSEALVSMRIGDSPCAPCQCLFTMSNPSAVPRLLTLLPRYARTMYEVTAMTDGDWLLHSRPMVSPSVFPVSTLNKLITSMPQLQNATNIRAEEFAASSTGAPSSGIFIPSGKMAPRVLPIAPFPGIPILQYRINETSIDVQGMFNVLV